MAEKDRGFSFKRLFLRDAETGSEGKSINKGDQSGVKPKENFISNSGSMAQTGVLDPTLMEDFVQRLQNLINQNDQTGFDFLEFTETLFEEKQNPTPEVYKTVFRIAQRIDKSLTPARLLESAMFYKDLVQKTAETEISKGTSKKQGLQVEKDTERNNLENSLKNTQEKIQQLTRQIQELQNQDLTLKNHLSAIDQKYERQFTDIDRKIGAIRSAKEHVIVSIVDIEAGIKSNLS